MASRKEEKQFYIQAQDEYKNKKIIDKAILAKAKTKLVGIYTEKKLEAMYIELRVEDLKLQKKKKRKLERKLRKS